MEKIKTKIYDLYRQRLGFKSTEIRFDRAQQGKLSYKLNKELLMRECKALSVAKIPLGTLI